MSVLCKSKQNTNLPVHYSSQTLKPVSFKNLNRNITAHLNINSLSKKFDLLSEKVKSYIDILFISETILYNSFPDKKSQISCFC